MQQKEKNGKKQTKTPSPPKLTLQIKDKFDREFIHLVIEIGKRYTTFTKQDKLKIENWIKKLCIPTINEEWKKDRNLHAILMLDMIINNKLEEPYNKFPTEIQSLPLLSKTVVKSRLSKKFNTEISLSDFDTDMELLSNGFLNQFFVFSSTENLKEITGRRLKEKKIELRQKIGKFNIKSKTLTHPRSKSIENIDNDNSHYNILNKNYSHCPFVDKKLINDYYFQRDIDKLKKLLSSLETENKVYIIF